MSFYTKATGDKVIPNQGHPTIITASYQKSLGYDYQDLLREFTVL